MNIKLMGPTVAKLNGQQVQPGSPIPGISEDEFAKLCASICIMVPVRHNERNRPLSALGFWARWGISWSEIEDDFGGEIAATRGGMVRSFLEVAKMLTHFRFLVMIDADESVDPLHPVMLALWNRPVVSGVVASPSEHGYMKACFTVNDEHGKARFPTIKYTGKIPARGLKIVNSVGAGMLCIKKEVLTELIDRGEIPFHIPDEVRRNCFKSGSLKEGEDISFSHQCKKIGIPICVDFSVRPPHHKMTTYEWPKELVDPDLHPDDWAVDPRDLAIG